MEIDFGISFGCHRIERWLRNYRDQIQTIPRMIAKIEEKNSSAAKRLFSVLSVLTRLTRSATSFETGEEEYWLLSGWHL